MQRKDFIKSVIGLSAMTTLSSLKTLTDEMTEQDDIMPVLFIGHGSPMNAIEDNEFSRGWKNSAATIPQPTAILMVSAHWETKGTFVTAMESRQRFMILVDFLRLCLIRNIPQKAVNGWRKKRRKSLTRRRLAWTKLGD